MVWNRQGTDTVTVPALMMLKFSEENSHNNKCIITSWIKGTGGQESRSAKSENRKSGKNSKALSLPIMHNFRGHTLCTPVLSFQFAASSNPSPKILWCSQDLQSIHPITFSLSLICSVLSLHIPQLGCHSQSFLYSPYLGPTFTSSYSILANSWLTLILCWDFPGVPVVKNLPCKAEDAGSIPGQETKTPYAEEQLSLCNADSMCHNWCGQINKLKKNRTPLSPCVCPCSKTP